MTRNQPAPYITTFFPETGPAWLNHAAKIGGGPCHDLRKPFRYLDAGCGFGYSLAIFALTHPHAAFVGIDNNPDHVDSLTRLARDWNLQNLTVMQTDLADIQARHAQEFDMITLTGIWSWIDQSTRAALPGLIDRLLAPGGLLYLSYNCRPGWATLDPVRDLLAKQAAQTGFDSALAAMLAETRKPDGWFARNPAASALLQRIAARAPELQRFELAPDMRPVWHSDLADLLSPFGILPRADLDPDGGVVRNSHEEDRRDFHKNRLFRRDVFQRDGSPRHLGEAIYDNHLPSSGLDQAAPPGLSLSVGDLRILPAGRIGNGVTLDPMEMAFLESTSFDAAWPTIDQDTITDENGHFLEGAEATDRARQLYDVFRQDSLPRLRRYGIAPPSAT